MVMLRNIAGMKLSGLAPVGSTWKPHEALPPEG